MPAVGDPRFFMVRRGRDWWGDWMSVIEEFVRDPGERRDLLAADARRKFFRAFRSEAARDVPPPDFGPLAVSRRMSRRRKKNGGRKR